MKYIRFELGRISVPSEHNLSRVSNKSPKVLLCLFILTHIGTALCNAIPMSDSDIMFYSTHQSTVELNEEMQKRLHDKDEIEKAGDDLVGALNDIKSEVEFTDFLRLLSDISRDGIPEKHMAVVCTRVTAALKDMNWEDVGQSKKLFVLTIRFIFRNLFFWALSIKVFRPLMDQCGKNSGNSPLN